MQGITTINIVNLNQSVGAKIKIIIAKVPMVTNCRKVTTGVADIEGSPVVAIHKVARPDIPSITIRASTHRRAGGVANPFITTEAASTVAGCNLGMSVIRAAA